MCVMVKVHKKLHSDKKFTNLTQKWCIIDASRVEIKIFNDIIGSDINRCGCAC